MQPERKQTFFQAVWLYTSNTVNKTIMNVDISKYVVMKTNSIIFSLLVVAASCGDSNQGGVINDGTQPIDPNGGLVDSTKPWTPAVDTAKGQNRVDIQQRDSAELFK
jgi:hypothetical protein